ncbi:MAG: cell division protein FtsW [Lachnospiraceae bacterium]|nr:cell division protein FtsW [Lachnospiraceae bacterium]
MADKAVRETKRKRKEKKRETSVFFFDYTLLFITLFLLAFGLLMVYSTSSYVAELKFGRANYYFMKQLRNTLLGLVAMIIAANFDYKIYKRFAPWIYLLSLALVFAVLVIGKEINGSKRWIVIKGISFQPSEFAKLAVIIFLAVLLASIGNKIDDIKTVAKAFALVAPAFVGVAITNLSNAIIIMAIALIMIFVSSRKYMQFVLTGMILVFIGALYIMKVGYRAERIDAWLHPETAKNAGQTLQGLYAIGSGGIMGKGLGQSIQKLGHVPEAQNDMIFSIICEELGLFGAVSVIVLFALMIYRFAIIIKHSNDTFGSLIVVGVLGHIATQVVLNIAVVTNTIPNTGISLPFISYGGTSVIFLLAEIGVVLNVSKCIKIEESDVEEG